MLRWNAAARYLRSIQLHSKTTPATSKGLFTLPIDKDRKYGVRNLDEAVHFGSVYIFCFGREYDEPVLVAVNPETFVVLKEGQGLRPKETPYRFLVLSKKTIFAGEFRVLAKDDARG